MNKKQEDKFIKAKLFLNDKLPFLWHLTHYLQIVETEEVPVAGVDIYGRLYLNMRAYDRLTVEDVAWLLAHEVMHIITATGQRFPLGGYPMLWNVASDILINQTITDDVGLQIIQNMTVLDKNGKEVATKPLYGKLDDGTDLTKYTGWVTEAVYYDLLKEHQKNCKSCQQGQGDPQDGQQGDGHGTGEGDGNFHGQWYDDSGTRTAQGEETQKQKECWKQRISSAKAASQRHGNLPGNLETLLTDLLAPQRDWRKDIRTRVVATLRRRSTWMRAGRRTLGIGVRTPGRRREIPSVAVYCDTSGSMCDDTIRRCISEAAEICKIAGGKMRLLMGDCEIYYDGEVDLKSLSKLPVQRGGTDFTVLFDKIADGEFDEPKLLIGFTDAYGPFPAAKPGFPVIWALLKGQSGEVPWGDVVEIDVKV